MASSTRPLLQRGVSAVQNQIYRTFRYGWNLDGRYEKYLFQSEGYVFTDADYSQIELRILAHMSGDERLIEAYRESRDIHATTASQVFHVPLGGSNASSEKKCKGS